MFAGLRRRAFFVAGLALVIAAVPMTALAGKGWCRSDPIIEIDGQLISVEGAVWMDPDLCTITTNRFVIRYTSEHTVTVIDAQGANVDLVPSSAENSIRWTQDNDCAEMDTVFAVTPLADGPIAPYAESDSGHHVIWAFAS
jgi:hypothetical protein